MSRLDTLPPDDSTPETRAWEEWAGKVRLRQWVRVAGMPATVTAITDDYLWVRLDGRDETEPFDWSECGPYNDGHMARPDDGGGE